MTPFCRCPSAAWRPNLSTSALAVLLIWMPCCVVAVRHAERSSSTAFVDCPEWPRLGIKVPPQCIDSQDPDEQEIDGECCTQEKVCLTEARDIINEYTDRLSNVYVSKCGLNPQRDLAKSANGDWKVTNWSPICSSVCQGASEFAEFLESDSENEDRELSDKCTAYPEAVAMLEDSEYIFMTIAVDEAWMSCSEMSSFDVLDCPEWPQWSTETPSDCVDSRHPERIQVDAACCTEEKVCYAKALDIIDTHQVRLDVYTSRCGLDRENDLAESASGNGWKVTNLKPICSSECKDIQELDEVIAGETDELSAECAAYPDAVAMLEESEFVVLTRAVDEALKNCPEEMPSTYVAPSASKVTVDAEQDCPRGFFPRQCIVDGRQMWKQQLRVRGCRGNLLALQLPRTFTDLLGALSDPEPYMVLLRVAGTNSVTDLTRKIPKELDISMVRLTETGLEADRGIRIKRNDGLALDLDVLGTDGSVEKTFSSTSLIFYATPTSKRIAHVLYEYNTINPIWYLGYAFGLNDLRKTTSGEVAAVIDDRLVLCSDSSAARIDQPDPDQTPSPSSDTSSDSSDWPDWEPMTDDSSKQERADEADVPEQERADEADVPEQISEESSSKSTAEQPPSDSDDGISFSYDPPGFTGDEQYLYRD